MQIKHNINCFDHWAGLNVDGQHDHHNSELQDPVAMQELPEI